MTSHLLNVGETFEGRYRITGTLGKGGFAIVFRARQIELDREVALKVLLPEELSEDDSQESQPTDISGPTGDSYSQELARRFKREAKLVSQLRDPHTITMYDYGETDDGLLYMVFEYVDGKDLKKVVSGQGGLAAERVVGILRQVLESLHEAHSHGVLHRDLKPANIMLYEHLGKVDQVKLLDFGIATRVLDKTQEDLTSLTQEGSIVGTPRYMAPEQIRGEDLTPAADLYSLGLVAFYMLTGDKPIPGSNSVEIIARQVTPEPIRLPPDLDLPAGLRRVLTIDPALVFGASA